jgi:hypothetical protein
LDCLSKVGLHYVGGRMTGLLVYHRLPFFCFILTITMVLFSWLMNLIYPLPLCLQDCRNMMVPVELGVKSVSQSMVVPSIVNDHLDIACGANGFKGGAYAAVGAFLGK